MGKRLGAILLAATMIWMTAACEKKDGTGFREEEKVSLNVTTIFANKDANEKNYRDGVAEFEKKTGITINNFSQASDEDFKRKIETDFRMGAEPDVLFFFTGADANSFIRAGKVVPLEEIQEQYPEYGANMAGMGLPASQVDGKIYAVPTNGYWEALYVNKEILEACGLAVPGVDYTWEQFIKDCAAIKDGGYIPIAAALGNTPHYWWEFSVFNNEGATGGHAEVPEDMENAGAWVSGMEDIKALYEAGYFPENTLTAVEDETFQIFMEGEAAFLLEGSWKMGSIVTGCQAVAKDSETLDEEKLAKYTVTYVPAKEGREATDLIGGCSAGYYITRKAWENEAKREAAVKFVEAMTTDEMIAEFAETGGTALMQVSEEEKERFNTLQLDALELVEGATTWTPALQDLLNSDCRAPMFAGMPSVVTGEVSAEDTVRKSLETYLGEREQ